MKTNTYRPTEGDRDMTDRNITLAVDLGARYRDPISGFEGVVTCVDVWLYGCQRVRLDGVDKDGKPESYNFDAPQLERIGNGISVPPAPLLKTGGPRGTTRA